MQTQLPPLEQNPAVKTAGTSTAQPAPKPAPAAASGWDNDDDEVEVTGFKKYRSHLIVGVLTVGALVGGGMVLSNKDGGQAAPEAAPMTIVKLAPLPPPPPPPPPPPEQVQQKQEEVAVPDEDEAPPDPTPAVATATKGNGPGGMKLGLGNSRTSFANQNAKANEAIAMKRYGNQAIPRIIDAIRANPKTRKSKFSGLEVHIWPDVTGRITRATLVGSTGDATVDQAIRDEVLVGLMLSEPPPEKMVLPIKLGIQARRPN